MIENVNDVKISDFELIEKVGNGRFGEVWHAKCKKAGFFCALKMLERKQFQKSADFRSLRREVNIHLKIVHDNILEMYGYFIDEEKIYLAIEYACNGDLWSYMNKHGLFEENDIKRIVSQVCSAVAYLHNMDILHRDIKPENLLLDENNNIKLSDFGWSVCNLDKKRKTFCGTAEYLCPEMFMDMVYDKSVDIWCIGVLTFELFTGDTPYGMVKSIGDIKQKLLNEDFKYPENINPVAIDFIQRCCIKDPIQRIDITELLSHPFLN